MSRLEGKVALVTGASRGIGASIAKRLAREGANVAFTYLHAEDAAKRVASDIEAVGVRALALRADSAEPHAVQRAVESTVTELGGIDVLVNNAGIAVYAPLEEFTLEDFDRLTAVNVRAVFVASQAAARHMKHGGRILSIGSCNAERVPLPRGTVYAMTKSALIGLHKGLARDLGPRGITANVLQVGPTDTDMNPANSPRADILRTLMAIPKYAEGDDIASFVAFLAGPESQFITGASLSIDGGYGA